MNELREKLEALAIITFDPKQMTLINNCLALLDGMGWQPIETAPKDGTLVLCYEYGECIVLLYDTDKINSYRGSKDAGWCREKYWLCYGDDGWQSYEPSHWMPLPQPP